MFNSKMIVSMSRVLFILILLTIFSGQVHSQQAAIGQWRQYLPFHRAVSVAQSENEVFFSSDGGIVAVAKEDQSAAFYTKINRLSSAGNAVVGYHQGTSTLIVTYRDGNIDLLGPEGTLNLPAIKTTPNIIGERRINHIMTDGNGAFLSSSFGLTRIDMELGEFDFTTLTGVEVLASARFQDFYYIATPEGIYRISLSTLNPADFSTWEYLDAASGFPPVYACRAMVVYEGALYLGIDELVYRYTGTNLTEVYQAPNGLRPSFLTAEGQHLLIGLECPDACLGSVVALDAAHTVTSCPGSCVSRPLYALEDQTGRIWYADEFRNFRISPTAGADCNGYFYNSPRTAQNYRMRLHKDTLYVASGSIAAAQQYTFNPEGVYVFSNSQWTSVSPGNTPAMADLRDFVDVAIHPVSGASYLAAYFEGLAEIKGTNVTVYNETNSSLGNAIGDLERTRISALAFDRDNNLWIANPQSEQIISVFTNSGAWLNLSPPYQERGLMDLIIDPSGFTWGILARGSDPLFVLDPGPDIEDTSDDRYRSFSESNSELPTNTVLSMASDLNGDVWVGTTDGVVTFDCGGSVFQPDVCRGSRRIVTIDGIPAFLLETEAVSAIAVDGGNRKWFGTSNGLFVLSPDGTEQIAHFTTSNSPLPANLIQSLVIDQQSGEVFIGTSEGIVSYQGEAIQGSVVNSVNITVFPNPVRPDYEGPIAIRGLARDADVKITDVHGNLVYETIALGGQAIWDGRDFSGRRASTGVYLVFSTAVRNFTNPDAAVARILFIN